MRRLYSNLYCLHTSLINGYAISDVSDSVWPKLVSNTCIRSSTVPRTQYTYSSANRWNSTTADRLPNEPKRKFVMYWASRGSIWEPQNFCNSMEKHSISFTCAKKKKKNPQLSMNNLPSSHPLWFVPNFYWLIWMS